MACKANAPGNPCCYPPTCCGSIASPGSDWMKLSDCCWQRERFACVEAHPGDVGAQNVCFNDMTLSSWTAVCSAYCQQDTREASCDYKIYKTTAPVVAGILPTPFFSCLITVSPFTCVCTDSLDRTMPDCDLSSETLCTTIAERHKTVWESKVVVVYKLLKTVDTLFRLTTSCDGDASSCKWILKSTQVYSVGHAQMNFLDTTGTSVTGGGSDCCCLQYYDLTAVTVDTCNSKALELLNSAVFPTLMSQVEFSRTKAFTSLPSGTYSMAAGDLANCTPATGGCVTFGTDTAFTICSDTVDISPGWIAATCDVTGLYGSFSSCFAIYHVDRSHRFLDEMGGSYCVGLSGCQPEAGLPVFVTVTGDLYGLFATNCVSASACLTTCDGEEFRDYFISKIECSGLSSSHSYTSYVPTCATIPTPMSWNVTI